MLATSAPYIVAASVMTLAALAALILRRVVEHLDPRGVGPLTSAPEKVERVA
jgi:hypothetical protein